VGEVIRAMNSEELEPDLTAEWSETAKQEDVFESYDD